MSFLENNDPQVIACGIDTNGIEIYNQFVTTTVLGTMQYEHVTIHVLDAVIGVPGPFSFLEEDAGFDFHSFVSLQNASGLIEFDEQSGMTVFIPEDTAFAAAENETEYVDSWTLFNNHVSIDFAATIAIPCSISLFR